MRWLAAGLWLAVTGAQAAEGGYIAPRYSADEIAFIQSLSLDHLGPPPADPSNRVADDPRAAALGKKLFFDARLSRNGKVSCATCHQPEHAFSDPLPRSRALGETPRHSMTVLGAPWQTWMFWDGRRDSLWAQALTPLEDHAEHGMDRLGLVRLVATHYPSEYRALFGTPPPLRDAQRFPRAASPLGTPAQQRAWRAMKSSDQHSVSAAFANIGKAIAAFERTLALTPARFDHYADALERDDRAAMQAAMTPDEEAGLRLFIGPARCIQCHNGPLFSNGEFHANGARFSDAPIDAGRMAALEQVRGDEFNCKGRYSDAKPEDCSALDFLPATWPGRANAFKTPTLRNVTRSAPYMRTGEFATLAAVMEHYNLGSRVPYALDNTEIKRLDLPARDIAQLEAFMRTLESPVVERPASGDRP
jgi:cytochrome c peroxidase